MFKTDFKDKFIPENSVIGEVEMMYHKLTGCIYGIKFMGDDGRSLLTIGYIQTPSYRADEDYGLKKIFLQKGERLCGIKSASKGE